MSKRKLEKEIARTKDPVLRKQLQELLDKRNQEWEQRKENWSDLISDLLEEDGLRKEGEGVERWGWGIWLWFFIIIVGLFTLFLETCCRTHYDY